MGAPGRLASGRNCRQNDKRPRQRPDTEAWQTGNQLLASGQWWPAIAAYQRAYAHTPIRRWRTIWRWR